jgi:hypothetical protein
MQEIFVFKSLKNCLKTHFNLDYKTDTLLADSAAAITILDLDIHLVGLHLLSSRFEKI